MSEEYGPGSVLRAGAGTSLPRKNNSCFGTVQGPMLMTWSAPSARARSGPVEFLAQFTLV